MKAIKITLLLLSILAFTDISFAQKGSAYTIKSTGEQTIIVNVVERDFDASRNLFLKRDPRFDNTETFLNRGSQLTSLEEAIYRTDNLVKNIEEGEAQIFQPNESLSLPMSIRLTKYNTNVNHARVIADSLIFAESAMTQKQLTDRMVKFGNTPTYFINGIEVSHNQISKLQPRDILSKEIKTVSAASGNPNGEIRFVVINNSAKLANADPKEYSNSPIASPSKNTTNRMTSNRVTSNRAANSKANKSQPTSYRRDYYEDSKPSTIPESENGDVPKRFRGQSKASTTNLRGTVRTRDAN